MMTQFQILMSVSITSVLALSLGACSTAKVRMMPGEDGVHKVVVRDIERDNTEERAVEEAHEYCEEHGNKQAVFVKEEVKYTGTMDEGDRNTIRKASTAAMILGSAGTIPGSTR